MDEASPICAETLYVVDACYYFDAHPSLVIRIPGWEFRWELVLESHHHLA